MNAPRRPVSTYRLQVRAAFDLHAAAALVPYLADLGVDWVYLSPLLPAEPGSDHGYDVVAHDDVDAARGGREGLRALAEAAHAAGLGVMVDLVPNHMGVAVPAHNRWWWDLLAHGEASRYAEAFDVDWAAGAGRVRIPVLADADARGDVQRAAGPDGPELRYYDHRYPDGAGVELVPWREADHHLNWRRFFAVTTLAGVRVEVPWVFDETHAEVGRWFAEGLVDGLRIDHPDGLRDPAGYLRDLARLTGDAHVVVEKILERGEELPQDWACAGTTGYEVLGLIDRVLTDPAAEAALPGSELDWDDVAHTATRAAAEGMLGSEVRRVVRELPPLPHPQDVLVDAVAEIAACFGVYRTYLTATATTGADHLGEAVERAALWRPDLRAVLRAVHAVLADPAQPAALRFQQTTGAVVAKGVEDTACYRYPRLVSLTEVGGDPSWFAVPVPDFHVAMAQRQERWPHAMTTTSTHDTKRGEDVRARITVLAEMPRRWSAALERLTTLAPIGSATFAPLLWQTVLGAWEPGDPDLRARLHAYATKALREAGEITTWTAPDEAAEAAVHAAVDAAFDSPAVGEVLTGLLDLVVGPGWSNSLTAKLVALTAPGAPDVYQGSELAERSLVDPDNRRPVDHDLRRRLLTDPALPHPERAKLDLVRAALTARRDRPEAFTGYAGLTASGPAAAHVLAFSRGKEPGTGAITVGTRLPLGLAAAGGWGDTRLDLPPDALAGYRDVLSGRPATPRLADLLATAPVALLLPEDA
ncbi:malto-oligosyltrehalose synthase [Nocardioides sp.]|uniref:malto-oligosyltrehalose synthase n=1 Tax=Nocardioides sp. TaxID=35761 RepID=UPI003517D8E0